jgi:lipopolysaccharide export system protein LptA
VLTAADISVELDAQNRARRVLVAGQPEIHANEAGGEISMSATQFEGLLNPAGWVERVTAAGNVRAARQTKAGAGHFAAAHVEFTMEPGRNLIQDMLATGGVTAESTGTAGSYTLRTAALRVAFSKPERNGRTRDDAPAEGLGRQQIESAETLAPATVQLTKGNETTTLGAKKFVAQAGANGRLQRVLGHSGVEVRRQVAGGAPQTISADEMTASLGANGEWESVQETGDVRMKQGDRQASASSARIDRAADAIDLDDSPVVTDGASRTSADSMAFNQKTGALQATGGVVSTYLLGDQTEDAVNLGSGAAHISADTLTGSAKSGHVTYAGHVRLWQGESVLEAQRIDIWRDGKKMEASGDVVAVFPQSAGPAIPDFDKSAKRAAQAPEPTRWNVRAPLLTYWGDQGRAHLEGGVTASSDQGTLNSRTLDVYLAPVAATPTVRGGAAPRPARHAAAAANISAGGELNRVVANGGVVVRQGNRRGVAEQAEYTAADGKFVLSGGHPTVTDGSSNTATGSSLTFYVANDTILIDSQEGSRTLTKHRVEK